MSKRSTSQSNPRREDFYLRCKEQETFGPQTNPQRGSPLSSKPESPPFFKGWTPGLGGGGLMCGSADPPPQGVKWVGFSTGFLLGAKYRIFFWNPKIDPQKVGSLDPFPPGGGKLGEPLGGWGEPALPLPWS